MYCVVDLHCAVLTGKCKFIVLKFRFLCEVYYRHARTTYLKGRGGRIATSLPEIRYQRQKRNIWHSPQLGSTVGNESRVFGIRSTHYLRRSTNIERDASTDKVSREVGGAKPAKDTASTRVPSKCHLPLPPGVLNGHPIMNQGWLSIIPHIKLSETASAAPCLPLDTSLPSHVTNTTPDLALFSIHFFVSLSSSAPLSHSPLATHHSHPTAMFSLNWLTGPFGPVPSHPIHHQG